MRWDEIILESQGPRPIRTYLEANCLAMGMVIQNLLGWSLEMLYFGSLPYHVVAKNPNGNYADARGPDLNTSQVLNGLKPLVASWKPSFSKISASEASELFDKNPSPALLNKAQEDLIYYWGRDQLKKLGADIL